MIHELHMQNLSIAPATVSEVGEAAPEWVGLIHYAIGPLLFGFDVVELHYVMNFDPGGP
jgi:hypothetical protein